MILISLLNLVWKLKCLRFLPSPCDRGRATSSCCPDASRAHCYTLNLGLLLLMVVVCGCCVWFCPAFKVTFFKKIYFSFLVSGSGWLAGTTCPVCFVLLFQPPASQVFHTVIRGIFKKWGVVVCYIPTGTWPPLWRPEPGLVVLPAPCGSSYSRIPSAVHLAMKFTHL